MLIRLTRWRQLAPLLLLVLLLSAGLSTTTLLLSGSSAAFVSSLGSGPNIVILSGGGSVPETGAVNLAQIHNASILPGVVAASPEAYAPALASGRVVVVRGVNESEFVAVQDLPSLTGPGASLSGDMVFLGKQLASTLGVQPGTSLQLQGLLANTTVTATVAAVVSPGQPFDDEVLAPLQMARDLRGLAPDQATFVRLKVNPAVFNETILLQTLRGKTANNGHGSQTNAYIAQLQLAPASSLISILPAKANSEPALETALTKGLGLAQTAFESLDVVVFLSSLAAIYLATTSWVGGVRPTAYTLSSLGLGKRNIEAWILLAAIPATILAAFSGYLIAYLTFLQLSSSGSLSFFFQSLIVGIDPSTLAFTSAGPAIVVAVSILLTVGRADFGGVGAD